MSKKLFIFDLDGVLVEACDWHRDALNEALMEKCQYKISEKDHVETFNGIPTSKKLAILSEMGVVSEDQFKDIHDLKQEKTIDIINQNAFVREEKVLMIQTLKYHNYIVCCYTNSIRKTAELMLEKTGIINMFDEIVTNQDVSRSKPDPEGYSYLINKYKIPIDDVYIIEDSPKGIQAAEASGANVIKVKNADDLDITKLRKYI